MTEEQRLRIASAEALGYTAWTERSGVSDIEVVMIRKVGHPRIWQPDIQGYEAQLVELIEWLLHYYWWHEDREFYDLGELTAALGRTQDKHNLGDIEWKLAIMRAVADVSNDNS